MPLANFRAPSSAVTRGDTVIGCVGCVVRRDGQRYLTTAAHVARRVGARLGVVGLGEVVVRDIRWDEDADIALLEPAVALPDSACRLPDHVRLMGMGHMPSAGEPVFAFRVGASVATRTSFEGFGSHRLGTGPSGNELRVGPLIATSEFTVDGDSGCLLFDASLGTLGTLVGEHRQQSVFLPLAPMLQSLGATLEK
jgi:hypothetical protein